MSTVPELRMSTSTDPEAESNLFDDTNEVPNAWKDETVIKPPEDEFDADSSQMLKLWLQCLNQDSDEDSETPDSTDSDNDTIETEDDVAHDISPDDAKQLTNTNFHNDCQQSRNCEYNFHPDMVKQFNEMATSCEQLKNANDESETESTMNDEYLQKIKNIMLVSKETDEENETKVYNLTKFLYSQTKMPSNLKSNLSNEDSTTSNVLKINHGVTKDTEKPGSIGARVIVDTGCPTTMAGLKWFNKLFLTMPKAIRSQLTISKSSHKFQFGDGKKHESHGQVLFPAYIMDDDHQAHKVYFRVELVDADIDMLFGGTSLDKSEATMDMCKFPSMTFPKLGCLGPGVKIPLRRERGHFVFYIFPPTLMMTKKLRPLFWIIKTGLRKVPSKQLHMLSGLTIRIMKLLWMIKCCCQNHFIRSTN